MDLFGTYDVVVVGAGAAGTVTAVRAAREGARTLLIEGSGVLGGLVTGGRLTKPTGLINGGVFQEMIERCVAYKGADAAVRTSYWGSYTGAFDAEVMQRVIIELVEEAGVEVLLRAQAVEAVMAGDRLEGLAVRTKSGTRLVLAKAFVDASGDGDVAALAGAEFMLGRPADGLTQPITSYFRVLNVDVPALVADCRESADDMWELVHPPEAGGRNEDYVMAVLATGFTRRIERAKAEGFDWIVPKNHMTLKTGLIPGEVSVNVTRFHGNGLDDRVLSRAEIEIRKQAYCAFDFLKRYVRGFEAAIFLEVAPKLGIRETRRIRGRYVLSEADVRGQARFPDAIGLCNSPVDVHEPGGDRAIMDNVGEGYGIPFRCLVPERIGGLYMAGRCISVDEVAFGSTRNVPACAMTGEAAAIAAAFSAGRGVGTAEVPVAFVQDRLRHHGTRLGTPA
ncbi:FAD-dependent oxidoreductase [Labrys wisconsinensis]|uniref:NADPH-dependent 2,4-dienoyl-CoA reductase/sulfur reductase-like enzyme n=1 Tax=Labrys wisconsinensis TaxID=425677 RepID=A0ABU0JM72_9HYPH|nr:FAD-dependent oxidoreductase [Labrys wisconsinensis]MDQ0475383.1 NADPH-dependent 2,4-dienoyl-CoA reductase/sulfur reductase-like enzyme [Labrys wisconsinensis]